VKEEGNALVDYDWDWSMTPPRQPERPADNTSKLITGGILVGSIIGLIWLVGNEITGLGVADDALISVATTYS
jgi:hypothetical protein